MDETFLTAEQWLERIAPGLSMELLLKHDPSGKNYVEALSKCDTASVGRLTAQVRDKFIKASEIIQKKVIEASGQELEFTHYNKDQEGWMLRDIGKQLYYSQSGMQTDERYLSGEDNNPFTNPKVLDNIVNLAMGYELTRPLANQLYADTRSHDSPHHVSSWIFTKIGEQVAEGTLNFTEIPDYLGEYWAKGTLPDDEVTVSTPPHVNPQPASQPEIDRSKLGYFEAMAMGDEHSLTVEEYEARKEELDNQWNEWQAYQKQNPNAVSDDFLKKRYPKEYAGVLRAREQTSPQELNERNQ